MPHGIGRIRVWAMAAGAALSVAALGVAAFAQVHEPPPPAGANRIYIHAGTLIVDAEKPPLKAQTIIVADGRIEAVHAGYETAPGARVVELRNDYVLPGLIDCHVHLLSELGPSSRLDEVAKSAEDLVVDGAANARKTLMAGFTTVADLGGEPDSIFALRNGVAAGKLEGPRIIAAGAAITPNGGHADVLGFRPEVLSALDRSNVCSGADDCRRAVREMVRRGADIIKLTATGGVLSNTKAGLGQQFTDDELKAIADTAHALGRRATAHAHGKAGIDAALRAGIDSIEHSTYADAESFALYKAKGAWLVPTVLAGATVVRQAREDNWMTPAQREKALQAGPLMLDMLRRAHAAGVKIAFGTDTGVSHHGDNAQELVLWVQAGFTPAEAIDGATKKAALHLGLENETGTIAPGLSADIIAVAGDPLKDVATFKTVDFVMARGHVAKGG